MLYIGFNYLFEIHASLKNVLIVPTGSVAGILLFLLPVHKTDKLLSSVLRDSEISNLFYKYVLLVIG
jgi:hypothetical protein